MTTPSDTRYATRAELDLVRAAGYRLERLGMGRVRQLDWGPETGAEVYSYEATGPAGTVVGTGATPVSTALATLAEAARGRRCERCGRPMAVTLLDVADETWCAWLYRPVYDLESAWLPSCEVPGSGSAAQIVPDPDRQLPDYVVATLDMAAWADLDLGTLRAEPAPDGAVRVSADHPVRRKSYASTAPAHLGPLAGLLRVVVGAVADGRCPSCGRPTYLVADPALVRRILAEGAAANDEIDPTRCAVAFSAAAWRQAHKRHARAAGA